MIEIKKCNKKQILQPCGLKNYNYQIDPYIGCEHLCYYCYVLNQAETDWTKEIRIYENIQSSLTEELENISPQKIYMGYYSDPYQPAEAEYLQTRKVLELLLERGFSVGILTKSDLVVRDIDLLTEMDDASVSVSVAFNNNEVRKQFEASIKDSEARIEALRILIESGIKTSALVCPVIPFITNVKPLIETLAPITETIWIYGLSMLNRSEFSWQNVQRILEENYPKQKEEIESIVFTKDHPYWLDLREDLNKIKNENQMNLNIHV
jgi:DNA repair photolyase